MKVRHKITGDLGHASSFNIHGLGEMIVGFDDGDMTSDFIRDYEVYIESGPRADQWLDMHIAFKNHDIINDNYNTHFFEPQTNEDRERGYTL